jgi:hypothetical protein
MNPAREENSGRGLAIWVALIVSAPLFYALSVGPVGALTKNMPSSKTKMVRRFYYPLIWLHDNTPLRRPIEVYCALWGFN